MNFLYDFKHDKKKFARRVFLLIAGNLVFALGFNLMIVPLNLYSGGFVGIAQLLNILIESILKTGTLNLRGILYFALNVPLFVLAYKVIGREFCLTSLLSIGLGSFFMSVVPIPSALIVTDRLTACLIGGVITGAGAGMILRSGSSGGGIDIIGISLSKTHPNLSLGNLSILVNAGIFAVCFLLFDIQTVLYSLIFAVITSLTLDKVYVQNINTQVMIFTKRKDITEAILKEIDRGVTSWNGTGEYMQEDTHVLVTVLSKYEVPRLVSLVREMDQNAFIVTHEGAGIYGHFKRKLS
ncbi:MAG: YitT family protein [Mogibacterium sp.]|nr:YitT family protein [Mogibacterium sp.]